MPRVTAAHAATVGPTQALGLTHVRADRGERDARLVDDLKQSFRRASFNRCVGDDHDGCFGALFSARMRGKDNSVTRLKRNQRFEDRHLLQC